MSAWMASDCERTHEWIELSVAGKLSASSLGELREHLTRCAPCRRLHEDATFIRAGMAAHVPTPCPGHVARRILDEIDAEIAGLARGTDPIARYRAEASWRDRLRLALQPQMLTRIAVPMAAAALLVFAVMGPQSRDDQLVSGVFEMDPIVAVDDGCDPDLDQILARLGMNRAQVDVDERELCAAADEVRLAMAVFGRAMGRTAEVLEEQTRGRMADSVRKGLEKGLDPDQWPGSHQESNLQQGG